MGMSACLDGFLSRLDATGSVRHTWEELLAFQKSLGFDLMMYGYASGDPAASETGVETLSNFPADYQSRYCREQYYLHDPVVSHCITHLTPLRVGRDVIRKGGSLSPMQRRIVNEAGDCGMRSGLAIPLRSVGRYPLAGLSLSNAMAPDEFERFLADWGAVAQLAALHAHTRMQMQLSLRVEGQHVTELSVRERDCLAWASRGLSSKEAAARMNLSSRTVEFHIANAMTKLKATSRIQAVARAMALGLVTP
jgi:DNA-binding CsgD family transcriptional regulator